MDAPTLSDVGVSVSYANLQASRFWAGGSDTDEDEEKKTTSEEESTDDLVLLGQRYREEGTQQVCSCLS